MESDIIIQDDWSQPNVQIEIELQPILESTPVLSDICIKPGSVQTNTEHKRKVSRDDVSKKTFCVEFTPKGGHDIHEQQAMGNKHLLIELTPKHNDINTYRGNNMGFYNKYIDSTTKTIKNFAVGERKRSVLNGFRKNKSNYKNNMIIYNNKVENKMIEVDLSTPINSINNTGNSKKNNEIVDPMNEDRDVENLLPIYMTPKFKDTDFPSYPVIEKVESLADVSTYNVEIQNAIMPFETPAVQAEYEMASLWPNQPFVPVLEVDNEDPSALVNPMVMRRTERVEVNYNANKAFKQDTRRPESASILEAPAALKPVRSVKNQMLKRTQTTDASTTNPNHELIFPVPVITIEAGASPVATVSPASPVASRLPGAPSAATPLLPTGGKTTLRAETYNNLLSRVKILNKSKPVRRPKKRTVIARSIRSAFKDVLKKDCSVSLPRILLYQCKDCSAARTSLFELVGHLCIAGNTKKKRYQKQFVGKKATEIFFKCGNCFKYYITKQHLMNHINLEHPGVQTLSHTVCYDIKDDLYRCNICNIEYKDERLLLDHYRETHIVMHKCPFCPTEVFVSRDLLITHFFESHRHVTSLYRCGLPDCFTYFTEYKDLIEHSSLAHGQSILNCIMCDTEYPDKDILLRHISTAHKKPNHVCEECHLHFPTIDLLLAHKAVPQSERHAPEMTRFLLQCRRCGRYFIKTIDNKTWPPKNSFLEPILCISCLIPSETTLTVKSDHNDAVEVLDTD